MVIKEYHESIQKGYSFIENFLLSSYIENIEAIENMESLSHLVLHGNQITDEQLYYIGENIKKLDLSNNNIFNIDALGKGSKTIKYINLSGNNISNIDVLSKLPKTIKTLNLSDNNITNIEAVGELIDLFSLKLDNNEISDLSPLENLTKLYELSLSNNHIFNIEVLGKLTNLGDLIVDHNQISDITPLENLTKMKWLSLDDNNIVILIDFSIMKDLYSLNIGDNPLDEDESERLKLYRQRIK